MTTEVVKAIGSVLSSGERLMHLKTEPPFPRISADELEPADEVPVTPLAEESRQEAWGNMMKAACKRLETDAEC